jgi:hypothetical protein
VAEISTNNQLCTAFLPGQGWELRVLSGQVERPDEWI